ncbi:MAG: hypothetical protein M5R40_17595 [Anaerolineae bacterium]|nr:hypothetical protein [Anaerolineae bacterium]
MLAVFRRGNNYLKSLPPGMAWPVTDFNPLTDMGRYIDTLPRVHKWTFTEVKSREGVPLDFVVAVEYGFDPSGLTRDKATDAISRGKRNGTRSCALRWTPPCARSRGATVTGRC